MSIINQEVQPMLPDYIQHSNAVKEQDKPKSRPLWAQIQEKFEGCPPDLGFGFQLPEDASEKHLRALISKKAKQYGRRFVVVKHPERWFEIARIREDVQPAQENEQG